jgi:hypothetical protein
VWFGVGGGGGLSDVVLKRGNTELFMALSTRFREGSFVKMRGHLASCSCRRNVEHDIFWR